MKDTYYCCFCEQTFNVLISGLKPPDTTFTYEASLYEIFLFIYYKYHNAYFLESDDVKFNENINRRLKKMAELRELIVFVQNRGYKQVYIRPPITRSKRSKKGLKHWTIL